MLIYEFTIIDINNSPTDYSIVGHVGIVKIVIPNLYSIVHLFPTLEWQPTLFYWLPLFMTLVSCICNALVPILNKRFILYQAYSLKLQEFQR